MSVRNYESDLQRIDREVATLFSLVGHAVASGIQSMIDDDRTVGQTVVDRDALIDSLYGEIEDLARLQFALNAPAALDMKFLVTVLRIVPELERSGDLAEHLGRRAVLGIFEGVGPRLKSMLERMGRIVATMWTGLADAYELRDASIEAAFRRLDEEVDELHVDLMAEIIETEGLGTRMAIELALTCRFLERLGDHAVHIARRVGALTVGVPARPIAP